jgi:hypothetical protein
MAGPFRAVLFDWRGTLFHDEDDAEWIRAKASIGRAQCRSPAMVPARQRWLGRAAERAAVHRAVRTRRRVLHDGRAPPSITGDTWAVPWSQYGDPALARDTDPVTLSVWFGGPHFVTARAEARINP